jgi:hypothetical protein
MGVLCGHGCGTLTWRGSTNDEQAARLLEEERAERTRLVEAQGINCCFLGGMRWVGGGALRHGMSSRKVIRPKKVQIAPNVVLRPENTPDLPDPRKQKFYGSSLAKLQFTATRVRFNIDFTVSQLARFCS